jgi:uncharacterized repeat protein (TIGR02543 family)
MESKTRFVIVLACAVLLCGCTMLTEMFGSYSVTYDANNATEGSAPADATAYKLGDSVTVADDTGSLARTGYAFCGWNTKADGSGTTYAAGSTFSMGPEDVTLYAAWNSTTATLASVTLTNGTISVSVWGSDFTDFIYDFLPVTGYGTYTMTVAPTDSAAKVRSVTMWSNTHGSILASATDGTYSFDLGEVPDAELTITIEAPDGTIANYLLYVYASLP